MKTPKSRTLGNALRKVRKERGLTMREFAVQLRRDESILSRWETGATSPTPDQVAQYLTKLNVTGELYDEIIGLAYGVENSNWVATTNPEQRQQLAALLDFEHNARAITTVSPLLIPGILQTTDYIKSMMSSDGVSSGELATRVTVRIGRREVIAREQNPVKLVALIGQAAIYDMIAGRDVMIAQLKYLIDRSSLPNVNIHVIPFNVGWHPAHAGPFSLIQMDSPKPVVFVENRQSGLIFHEDDDVYAYQRAAEKVQSVSLSSEDSLKFIADFAERLENGK